MAQYQDGGGSGGQSPSGLTTDIGLTQGLDPKDKAVLCPIVCSCNKSAPVGAAGQKLKQQCVSGKLSALDKASNYQSVYKPEVNYDMRMDPPAPIMSSDTPTQSHQWIPGWIQKYWTNAGTTYIPSAGNIRRPDVVVVDNLSRAPTQDNIKSVVEIKFPGDTMGRAQRADYIRIAGSRDKLTVMTPSTCGCGDEEPNAETEPSTAPVSDSSNSFADQIRKSIQNASKAPPGLLPGLANLPLPIVP